MRFLVIGLLFFLSACGDHRDAQSYSLFDVTCTQHGEEILTVQDVYAVRWERWYETLKGNVDKPRSRGVVCKEKRSGRIACINWKTGKFYHMGKCRRGLTFSRR